MKDLEKLIDEVNGSMSIEGMPLTKTDKDRRRRCAGNDGDLNSVASKAGLG